MRKIDLTETLARTPAGGAWTPIQKALDGGDVEVRLPRGRFVVDRTLKLYSGTRLVADPACVVKLADGVADFLLANADPGAGNADLAVEGGVWDANGAANPRGADEYNPAHFGGIGLNFYRTRRVTLERLTVANPDAYFIRFGRAEEVRCEEIRFFNNVPKINQDGVHLGGFCKNVYLRDLRAISPMTPGDDLVAINADDDVDRYQNRGLDRGPIENVVAERLRAESAYTFVRLLSDTQPIRHVRIRDLRGGARCNAVNVNRWRFKPGGGDIADVDIAGLAVYKMPWEAGPAAVRPEPLCDINLKVRDFAIRDFRRVPLDDGAGPTFRVDTGVRQRVRFRPDAASAPLAVDGAPREGAFEGELDTACLADGGFRELRID